MTISHHLRHLAGASSLLALASGAWAQTPATGGEAFPLGQIIVTAPRAGAQPVIGNDTLSAEAIRRFNRDSLDEAAKLIPGVTAGNSGGQRNERMIYVRGYNRFQVPLSIDGIRVYLPADNRLDYGRFLTPDIAQIQVAKGYASVLDGPGAMGGAVNLVTSRPTREVEAEARGTVNFDNDADYAGYTGFARLGTRQDQWYGQVSYSRNFTDHWDLPDGFTPTATEDGGERDFSRARDSRLNLKLGWTPNATDEYAISYTKQEGAKNAPLHVTDSLSSQRYWSWPQWDIDSLYFLSATALGDAVTLKTRAYRTGFDNLLRAFDNRNQNSQTLGRAFNSYYDDEAWGGSLRLDADLGPLADLGVAFHYRRDRHVEWQQSFPAGTAEPKQTNEEDTYSLALEDRLHLSEALTLTLGGSIDWRDLRRAEEYGTVPGESAARIFSYPIKDSHAVNGQARLDWAVDDDSDLYASLSSRTRFPTIFERFSSRFGGAVSNPDLDAERATQIEIGANERVGRITLSGALFHAWLDDAITDFPFIYQSCTSAGVCTDNAVSQSRNVGEGTQTGVEFAITARLADGVEAGANYTYLHRDLDDPSNASLKPTGVPSHKGFVYVDWTVTDGLRVLPNLELASDRWTVNTAGTRYYRTGAYALAGLRLEYDVTDRVELAIGGQNLFDADYSLTDGFPEPGRRLFISLSASY